MIEADVWVIIVLDILLFGILPAIAVIFAKCWWNTKRTRGCIVAEIWEPNGDTPREIVKPDPTGHTVVVDNLVYRLPRELSDEEIKKFNAKGVRIYPRKRWIFMSNKPLPPIPLRIESWERDNPEPIRPFYGRITEDGKFDDSQLTVTSSEWQAQKSVIQAMGIAMSIQQQEAIMKEQQKLIANIPNKMIIYIGLGITVAGSVIGAVMVYQMAMG